MALCTETTLKKKKNFSHFFAVILKGVFADSESRYFSNAGKEHIYLVAQGFFLKEIFLKQQTDMCNTIKL